MDATTRPAADCERSAAPMPTHRRGCASVFLFGNEDGEGLKLSTAVRSPLV